MSKIEIKRIDQNEADLVVGLFNQYRIFYGKLSDLGMAKAFIDARLESSESVIFVALEENKPVAFTQLYPKYSSVRLVKNWILNDLFVDPEYRKKGIGEALIKTVMDFGRGQGSTFVQLETAVDNFTAQSLYEQIGFVKQGPDEEFLLYKIEI